MKNDVSCRLRPSTIMLLAATIFCSIQPTVATAQDVPWSEVGPVGIFVRVMAIDPRAPKTVYAGLVEDIAQPYWGVIKSIDGGNTWTPVNAGPLADSGVFGLAIDGSTNPSTVYAALSGSQNDYVTVGGGVFKSTDGGNNWTQLNVDSLATYGAKAILIDPLTPSTVFVSSDPAANLGKLYKTTDGGASWVDVGFPNVGSPLNVLSLAAAVDPITSAETFYAGTDAGGIYVSTDNGTTWSPIGAGLPSMGVSVMTLDPVTPTTMYAGFDGFVGGTETGAVFKSTDGGVTWSEIDNFPMQISAPVHTLAINPANTSTLYVGFWGNGAYTSTNGGQSWSDFNSGLPDAYVHSIVVSPTTPTTIYAGTCVDGVFVMQSTSGPSSESRPVEPVRGRRADWKE